MTDSTARSSIVEPENLRYSRTRAFSLAAALLAQDRRALLFDILLLSVPFLFLHASALNEMYVLLLMRGVEALVMMRIILRTIRHFQQVRSSSNGEDRRQSSGFLPHGFLRFLLVSMTYFSLVSLPFIIMVSSLAIGSGFFLIGALLAPLSLYLGLKYYYVHFLVALPTMTVREALFFSQEAFRRDWVQPVLISLFGLGVLGVTSQLIFALSPDGSSATISLLSEAGAVLARIAIYYLFSATALLMLDSERSHRMGLLPYQDERLETLTVQTPVWLKKIVSVSAITPFVFLSLITLALNQSRASKLLPSEDITIAEVSIDEHASDTSATRVRVTLESVDRTNQHRVLKPLYFRVANETDSVQLAAFPVSVMVDGQQALTFTASGVGRPFVELGLEFDVALSLASLRRSPDVFLWYRKVPIGRLNIADGELEAIPNEFE